MFRQQFHPLQSWLERPDRKPLILPGARQVGKSTLVRLFAERAGRPLTEVNLERHPDIGPAFARNDPGHALRVLEALPRVRPIAGRSLLFLDEIQAAPEAIPALRYFREERPDLPVLAAGSLLDFALAEHRLGMPVGRLTYLHMGPMTFTEFLRGIGEERLASMVETFEIGRGLDSAIHGRLLDLLRTYLLVGGMPEAVAAFARSGRLSDVNAVHHSVIETYREDLPRYVGSRSLPRIASVFNLAARYAGRKVKYVHFARDVRAATIRDDIARLCLARVLARVTHSDCRGLPLQAEADPRTYKLLFLDVGLMNAVCGLDWRTLGSLDSVRLVNEGAMAEQFIGQHLLDLLGRSANRELTYWLRERRSANAEVDFVVALGGRIVPVEVKAGASGSLKSLHQFVASKHTPVAVRFDASQPSVQTVRTVVRARSRRSRVRYRLVSLPLYLVERLPAVLASLPA